MTEWTDERIPLWVPPVEGEALDSWLAAYSRRLRTDVSQFLSFVGLHGTRPNHMVRCLTERERQVLSERTGLAPERLIEMTLEPWDGVAVSIDRPTRRLIRPPNWRHTGNTTRYCPGCLGESAGRWQISWRLPWSFACTRHGTLLLDRCPACGQLPMVHGRRSLRDTPLNGLCLRHRQRSCRPLRLPSPACRHPPTPQGFPGDEGPGGDQLGDPAARGPPQSGRAARP